MWALSLPPELAFALPLQHYMQQIIVPTLPGSTITVSLNYNMKFHINIKNLGTKERICQINMN